MVWFLDRDYLVNMRDLFKKVSVKEKVVGWYHSGPGVKESDLSIHGVFAEAAVGECAVMVVFKVEQGCLFDAYLVPHSTTSYSGFVHVKGDIQAEEAEEVGVEHLLRDVADTAAGTLSRGLAVGVKELVTAREGVSEIVDYLQSGKLNPGTVVELHDLLNALYRHQVEEQGAAVDEQVRIYVGQLASATLHLHDLIENKEGLLVE